MASTPTSNLRIELQASGENDDQWGDKLNAALQLLENAITKRTALTLASTNVTLSTSNFADDQARNLVLALSGTLTGNVAVIVPNLSHFYLIENLCTGAFTVTVKTSAGTGIVVTQDKTTILYCNGTNVVGPVSDGADAATLDGLDSAAFAQLAVFNQFVKGSGHTFVTAADGGTVTLDCSLSDRFIVTLAGNRTLAFSNPADGQTIQLWVLQDATGGRTLSYPSNVAYQNGVAPTLSSIASGLDVLTMTYNLVEDLWVLDTIAGLAGGGTVGLTLSTNEVNVRMFERAGSPTGASTINITVQAGVCLSATSTGYPALDLTGFPSGTVINLVNLGIIHGMGGRGGDGAEDGFQGSSSDNGAGIAGKNGRAGGSAIVGPGSGRTFNITNATGRIWGGGGGGGGGGCTVSGSSDANGGGGGGGAGGGLGGSGGTSDIAHVGTTEGDDGGDGSAGYSGVGGSGGSGHSTGGGTGFAGGSGGNFGDDGTVGSDGSLRGGSAGTAGKAVDLNGGTATFLNGNSSPNVEGNVA